MKKKTIHLVVTPFCDRDCKYCCNKKYDIHNLPVVTDEELKNADMLCLTGGEPFAYTKPVQIAYYYHKQYPELPIIVYTNAWELYEYWLFNNNKNATRDCRDFQVSGIKGLNICIKNEKDLYAIKALCDEGYFINVAITLIPMTRIIVMEDIWDEFCDLKFKEKLLISDNVPIINRPWQKDFQPAPNCLFRRI